MEPITFIQTPFPEKFGIPRQSLLVKEAWGKMQFPKNDFYSEAFRGLENFSHLWLIFQFHQVSELSLNGLVRPPRFDGKEKLGVFATRTPHRPNRLGLSVVEFDRIEFLAHEVTLWVKGVDLLSGTPIFDIKPYIPYADSVPQARANLFQQPPREIRVEISCEHHLNDDELSLIQKIISLDPRPAHDRSEESEFGVAVAGYNVRFRKLKDSFSITNVTKV